MINECQHHAECARTRSPSPAFTQTILTNEFGLLSISLPAVPTRRRRTPLPHAIQRIVKVYRLLLKFDNVIQYGICPVKQRLVWRKNKYSQTPPWIRHGLFPSILECCRTTNQEGSVVLYGENWFQIERWESYCPVGPRTAESGFRYQASLVLRFVGYMCPRS
jgi:hypothetical protein